MRIVCVHPARDPVPCGNGPLRIGSATDNDIVPIGVGVDPHHATLTADARGLVLGVLRGCQRVYVNARAVREKALLRYGDTVTLGANKFLVTSDVAPPQADDHPETTTAASVGQPVLRIVSGVASGQAIVVAPELRLGAGSRHFADLAYGCRILQQPDGLIFESASAAPRVNGWRCSRVRLSPGDQIVLGEHRLVVEAPGLQYAAHLASLPPPPVVVDEAPPAPQTSATTEIWWLIAAAALLAGVIALFLYFRW